MNPLPMTELDQLFAAQKGTIPSLLIHPTQTSNSAAQRAHVPTRAQTLQHYGPQQPTLDYQKVHHPTYPHQYSSFHALNTSAPSHGSSSAMASVPTYDYPTPQGEPQYPLNQPLLPTYASAPHAYGHAAPPLRPDPRQAYTMRTGQNCYGQQF
jgi:hypothetical protein